MAAVPAVGAAVPARAGEKRVAQAGTPVPERTIDSLKADPAEIKEKSQR
ncbi:phage holin family protein [Streptomyces sp. NPDC058701]